MDVDEAEVEMQVTPAPDEQPLLVDEQPTLAAAHLVAAHFVPFPFTPDVRNAILARRALMSDELVFDLLLEQASIAAPHALFPPDSPDALTALLDAIAQCPWDALKKSSLLFYLLSHVSPRVAAEHAALWALPDQFVHLAHACFLLDAGAPPDLAHAVALLADARIVQDLSSKILHTLALAPQPAAARLVRTYVRTAQPVLDEYDDLAIYLRALLQSSLAAAWSFQRTFAESTPLRNQLFRTVLDACLIPPNPAVLPHLLSLPLTTFEFSLLQAYALAPPDALAPAAHAILQDLLTVRLLHSGKYSDAVRLARAFDTLNAAKQRTGTETGAARRQLEHELADEPAAALGASWASVGSDVAMSWESLGASGGAERAPARDGRLEGSPAPPKAAGRTSAPNTPFGLFASPAGAGAAQKRKIGAHAPAATHGFGTPTPTPGRAGPPVLPATPTPTPTPGRARPPVLPTIPTPGLDASVAAAAAAPLLFQGFRPPPRPGVPQNGAGHAPASPFAGLASPARFGFGRPAQTAAADVFAAPARGGGEAPAPGAEAEADVVLVESDDPDSFVLRRPRRRRTASHPPPHAADPDADTDMGDAAAPPLFGRDAGPARTSSRPQAQEQTETHGRVLPGGLTSFEVMGDGAHAHARRHDAAPPPPPPHPDPATGPGPARKPSPQAHGQEHEHEQEQEHNGRSGGLADLVLLRRENGRTRTMRDHYLPTYLIFCRRRCCCVNAQFLMDMWHVFFFLTRFTRAMHVPVSRLLRTARIYTNERQVIKNNAGEL
ncbi:nuclear pore complex assembly-domain-containing protein [Gautieria morchelliformis]|nr:nuclear pore complex assembly-domain-containing protein [Gautieria morchelliformis]